MSQSAPKPLPDSIRRAIAQAVVNSTRPINLVVKAHCNKQMTLTLVEGPFKRTLLRLHKRAHKTFYQVVAAAKRLLANLMAALADPLPAPVAPIPATISTTPAAVPPANASELWRTMSNPVGSIDTPLSRWESRQIKTAALVQARHNQMIAQGLR